MNAIFSLHAIKKSPSDEVNAVDQLILDFHYTNFTFCNQHGYSNEKISTLLGIMDYMLHTMVARQLTIADGQKLLKDILE